jgi:hypothetical protein
MPMVTEPAQTNLTETPLEPIGPLDTKVVQCLVSYSYLIFYIIAKTFSPYFSQK